MKFKLEKNAIDTLQYAVSFFEIFISNSDNQNLLKPTVLFLENAVELLLKSILIIDDPLNIYEKKCMGIVDLAQKKIEGCDITLAEVLICEMDIKTISFSEALNRYCAIYSASDKLKEVFIKLSKYRNSITHFGIDASDKLDDFICNIYDSFEVISNDLYPQLREVDEYFGYNDFLDSVEPFIEGSQEYIRCLCINNANRNIISYIEIFKKVLYSVSFSDFTKNNNIKIEYHILDFETNFFWFEVTNDSNCLWFSSFYSSFHNATIFTEDDGMIHFVVEHYTGLIYDYFKESYYCDDEPEKFYQWRSDNNNGLCVVKKLTEENLFLIFTKKLLS